MSNTEMHEFRGNEKALFAQKVVLEALTNNPDISNMDIANELLSRVEEEGDGSLDNAKDIVLDVFYYAVQRLRPMEERHIGNKASRKSTSYAKEKTCRARDKVVKSVVKTARQRLVEDLMNTTFAVARAAKSLPIAMLREGDDDEVLGQYFSKKDLMPYVK